jgi:hypothetical protein
LGFALGFFTNLVFRFRPRLLKDGFRFEGSLQTISLGMGMASKGFLKKLRHSSHSGRKIQALLNSSQEQETVCPFPLTQSVTELDSVPAEADPFPESAEVAVDVFRIFGSSGGESFPAAAVGS